MVIELNQNKQKREMRRTSVFNSKKADEIKYINVSEKRQVTIPKHFYEKLEMGHEVICELRDNEIVLRNIPQAEDFSEEILKDLVAHGYEGQELIQEFQNLKTKIRPAVEKLKEESSLAAQQLNDSGDKQTAELFNDVKE